jgi:glycerol-3-phosphate dehydrogenase subunit B
MRDTIVVGAGFAGMLGALALAEAGQRPLVLAKGQGTTHWASGCIDVWGEGDSPRAAVRDLIAAQPEHPYALVGLAGLEAALERFTALTRAAGLPYAGSLERNLRIPTASGAIRPACLLPATMAAADMRIPGPLLIVGFHQLRDFYPPLIAANLRAQGVDAHGVYLDLPPTERKRDFSPRNIALLFDKPELRQAVARQVRDIKGAATRVAFPAVLGLHHAVECVREMQASIGALVFEIATLPPSVPGMRLFHILRRALETGGGRVQIGSEVRRAETEGAEVRAVYSEAAAREQRHSVGKLLLATGGIAGGGIRGERSGELREAVLGLPVRGPSSRADWFHAKFMHAEGQPVFRAGIAVDAAMRPVDSQGQPLYQNVRVAGTLLAGAEPIRERCYEGLALATGFAAGRALAQSAATPELVDVQRDN